MKFLLQLSKGIDFINEYLGRAVAWLSGLMVLVVIFDVFLRYVLQQADNRVSELGWHLFALIFLLGAGYTLKHDRHVRVDLFYDKFSGKDKSWVNLIGNLIFLIPWCILVIYASYGFAMESYSVNERSPNPDGLPARYVIKFAILFGIFFLLLQAISNSIKAIQFLQKGKTDENE